MSTVKVNIRPIPASATVLLRHTVSWPSLPLSEQLQPYDHSSGTLHLGAFLPSPPAELGLSDIPDVYSPTSRDQQPVGCLTVAFEPYEGRRPLEGLRPNAQEMALHRFQVLTQLHGRGIGRLLVENLISRLRAPGVHVLLHFDTRLSQVPFYERLGVRVLDEEKFVKKGRGEDGEAPELIRMGFLIE